MSETNLHLIGPLFAAVAYAFAALATKASSAGGVEALRITFVANCLMAASFSVFVPWGDRPFVVEAAVPAVALGALFFLGQVTMVLSLAVGDVSVATPVMGTKVVMVAFLLAFVFGEAVGLRVWIACVLTVAGIASLHVTDRHVSRRRLGAALACALLAAFFFAAFDVVNQVWSRRVGYGRFVPLGLAVAALLSLAFLPFCRTRLSEATRAGRLWLGAGAALLALQGTAIVWTIGRFGDAARCNVVYGSRALWSIAFAIWLGHWFGAAERGMSRRVLVARGAGAALILAGIALAAL